MNATATFHAAYEPQPLLSGSLRAAAAAAVCGAVLLAWAGMTTASHTALDTANQTFSQGRTHVTFQTVQITGRRDKKVS